ncbi:hypothetical protein [Corynebacterium durum]|uniref:hypothetical protein n=1 Tax=Corynebacterium durum TaxID=61592 RepID=UPI00389A1D1B
MTSEVLSNRAKVAAICIVTVPFALAACSSGATNSSSGLSTTLTPSTAKEFVAKEANPVTTQDASKEIEDPGLNVRWRLRSVSSGSNGGVVILLNLKNLNDVPLPPSALGQPTLKTKSGNAELMNTNSNSDDGYVNGLDLPLGAGATTSVRYTFNTTVSSTSDAELTIANVTWKGNLQ